MPVFILRKILMEDDLNRRFQHQRRVNPKIHEVIKKEVIKLLDAGLIYPISDSPWVSPVHCVPKKGGMTVVENEDNELIPIGVTGWQCMMANFHDMIEETMEVFMYDFLVFEDSFSSCLSHLDKMLKRCEDTNLVPNLEKCHFMVKECIVLGHKISKSRIEVDRAKVDVIAKLPHPTSESTIPLNEIVSQIPLSIAITPVLPNLEPEDSLIMGDENLSTILEKESDEFIKSSVEDLVLIPSESEDTSGSDSECDLPSCNNFSPINVSEEKSVTFSNPLFDSNDDFTSSDDESLSDEDVTKYNVKIYSNPLFKFDDEYISSDVNPLFDEVLEDIEGEDSYVSKLDEPDLLVTPLSKLNEDECFDPGGDFVLEEIEACLTSDSIPPGIDDDDFDPEGDILLLEKLLNDDLLSPLTKEFNFEELKVIKSDVSKDFEDDYYDSEGDIIYLKNFLIKATIPNLPPEVFLNCDPRSLEDKPDKDDLKNIVKVFDLGIHEKTFSPTYVRLPFEDHHYLFFTYVIRIFLPYFIYPVDFPFLLSSGSEDTIFDPGISAFHFSSLEPIESHRSGTFMCFNDCPDYEDSRARGFIRFTRASILSMLIWESDILDLID
ncbi:hypothetical protein Tco_0975326 [Tanacetum coccineum]|uniref:Reverse transcriptase domain-containing protein n=1 Tax=Tanacetum coccineum TaxID=301880 RepID=A0ABQ5EE29_9ASTR